MASLGGQGAKGFAKGLTQGYGAVDSALTNKQNRDIQGFKQDRAEEIYALAKQKEQQIAKVNQVASATETNTKTQQTVDVLTANQKASNANQMSSVVNNVVSSSDPIQKKDAIANANTLVKNNPSLQKTIGMGPNDIIEDLDLKLPKDNIGFTRNLGGLGITPKSMGYDLEDPEDLKAWNEFKGEMQPLLSMVKVGENYIDAEALGRGMKTPSRASAQEKKDLAKTQMKQETAVKKAQNSQVDKQIASTKAKADAAGIYFNPEVLAGSSVEEKQEIIDGVNKSIRQSATKDPMAGTETTQLDYKGGKQGMPTTEAMVNGEMVNVGEDGVVVDKSGKPIVTKNADGSKVTYKQGEAKGTTETTTVAKDGTKTVKTTEDQSLLKPETAKATENVEVVEASIQTQASRGTPASDEYMRHLYALAGKTYPIPDDTAKMKNYKFMTANGATDEQARKAIFPATKALTVTAKVQEYEALVKSGIDPKDAVKTVWKHDKPATIASKVQEYNELKKTMSSTEAAKVVWGKEGKPPAAKVQEVNNLVTKGKTIDEALDMIYGSDKNITSAQIIADWRKVNPDATEDELLKFSAAVRGKYEPKVKGTETEKGAARLKGATEYSNKVGVNKPGFRVTKDVKDGSLEWSNDKNRATFKKDTGVMDDLNTAYQQSKSLLTDLKNPKLDMGWAPGIITTVGKILPTGAFGGLSDDVKEEHILKITGNTKAGMILSSYLRSISGTAVADAEYQRLANIFNAGSYSNKESYEAAVTEFADGIRTTVRNKAKALVNDVPSRAYSVLEQTQTPYKELKVGEDYNGQKIVAVSNTGKLKLADGTIVEGE